MGKILVMKNCQKFTLIKLKFCSKRVFLHVSKRFKNLYLLFYVKKNIKECPVPLDISIKSNRKHHKTVLYSKSNKNMVGRLFGRFFVVFWRFFHKNIWSPWSPRSPGWPQIKNYSTQKFDGGLYFILKRQIPINSDYLLEIKGLISANH